MNVKNLLLEQAGKYKDKTAIVFNGIEISFNEIKNNSFKIANYLLDSGIEKGDKTAVFMSNTGQAINSLLGIYCAGAVVVPLDFMLTEEEIIHFINHSEAKILIAQPRKGINFDNIINNCPGLKNIVVAKEKTGNFIFLDEVIENGNVTEPAVEAGAGDFSSIFYTSGSTGKPKGVILTHAHLDNPPDTINHFLSVTDNDIFLCGGVPFSHVGGLDYILLMLKFGSKLVLMERFNPFEFLKSIERFKVSVFCIVPAMYMAILSLKEYERFDLSSLRYAVVFGAPSSPALLQKFHLACPEARVLNGWGMTETAAPNTFSPHDETKLSSIGKFGYSTQAKIVNDSGDSIEGQGQGELWVKGAAITPGYYKAADLTNESLTQDGWFKTGDIARCDSEGFYYIAGRKKDMIKVAGEIVFSAEVEEKIHKFSKVKEAAVIGIPDRMRGEVPKAFIVAKDNQTITLDELKNFLKIHLAHFKIPHYFEFLDNLPKNRTGKVDKAKLANSQQSLPGRNAGTTR
ncbi:MAG: class I adenylate-forming enzyme family protein [Candidatus Omnitrophota bacterium]